MVSRCEEFRSMAASCGVPFIQDGSTVLVHSYSRLVLMLLKKASATRHFRVYVTSASFSQAGYVSSYAQIMDHIIVILGKRQLWN